MGYFSVGYFSLGYFSLGYFSLGYFSLGYISLGYFSLGLLWSVTALKKRPLNTSCEENHDPPDTLDKCVTLDQASLPPGPAAARPRPMAMDAVIARKPPPLMATARRRRGGVARMSKK